MPKSMFLVLVILLSLVAVPIASASQSKQVCDIQAYLEEVSGYLGEYGERFQSVGEGESLYDLYSDLMETRNLYEDDVVCEDLLPIRSLFIQVLSTWQDSVFFMSMSLLDEDNTEAFLVAQDEVLPRFSETLDTLLAEAATLID